MESKSTDTTHLHPLIESLVAYTNSTEYINKVQTFFRANYREFQDYEEYIQSGRGHKLEWQDVFNSYLEILDDELDRFCHDNNVSASEVYDCVREYVSSSGDDEFIPLFLKTTDELHFFEHMGSYATGVLREQQVLDASESKSEGKGEDGMGGVWQMDPERIDVADMTNWLVKYGVPWPFRKLFIGAHKKPLRLIIAHDDTSLEITNSVPFFGSWTVSFNMDGSWKSSTDRRNNPIRTRAIQKSDCSVEAFIKSSKSSLVVINLRQVNGTSLVLRRELYVNGRENKDDEPDAVFTLYFNKL